MNEKDRIQRQYLQEKMYEERAARLAELEYQRKIQADKASNAVIKLSWDIWEELRRVVIYLWLIQSKYGLCIMFSIT